MAYSFGTMKTNFGTLSLNSSSANLTLGAQLINDGMKKIYGYSNWSFLENSATVTSVANQQFYNLPPDFGTLINITMLNGTTSYNPIEMATREAWDYINSNTNVTSNVPSYYFIYGNRPAKIGLFPTPSSNGQTINLYYRRLQIDLSVADLVITGQSTSVTNNTTTLTCTTGNWGLGLQYANAMIQIANTFAGNSGDGMWYPIASVASTTVLTLATAYTGASVAATASTVTVGQFSYIPDEFQVLPLYYALWQYWLTKSDGSSQDKAKEYKIMFYDGLNEMKKLYGNKTIDPTVSSDEIAAINPNLLVTK